MAFSESNSKCNLNNPRNSFVFTVKHTFTLSHSVSFAQMTNKSHNILCLHRITFMLCQEILRSAGPGGHLKVPWKRERISKEPFSLRSTLDYLYLRKRKRKSPGLCNYVLQFYPWFPLTASRLWEHNGYGVTKVIFYSKSMIVFGTVYGTKVSL